MCWRSGKWEVEGPNESLDDEHKELAKVEIGAFPWIQAFTEVEQTPGDVVVPNKAIVKECDVVTSSVAHLTYSHAGGYVPRRRRAASRCNSVIECARREHFA